MNNDKKIMIRFVFIMIISLIIGGFIGFLIGGYYQELFEWSIYLSDLLITYGVFAYGIGYFLLLISTIYYFKAKSYLKALEDEINYETANKTLSKAMIFNNVAMPLMFICLGLSAFSLFDLGMIVFLLIVVYIVWTLILSNVIIKSIKQMAPEKKGNVFDVKFQKDWYESCDELEKLQIGNACYKTFKCMTNIYLVSAVIICCLSYTGFISPFWILFIGMLWILQQAIYSIYCMKENI